MTYVLLQMTPAAAEAQSEMLAGIAKLFESGRGSDFTTTCQGKKFNVHSAIIASRCKFFAAACWGGFEEAQNYHIDLSDDHPLTVELMLRYLYGLDYITTAIDDYLDGSLKGLAPFTNSKFKVTRLQLFMHAHMYSMGDKYGIDGLKGLASENFATFLKQPHVMHEKSSKVTYLCAVIDHIYRSTPETDRGLRDQILRYVRLHLRHALTFDAFKALLAEIPEFSYQLLVQEAESRPS